MFLLLFKSLTLAEYWLHTEHMFTTLTQGTPAPTGRGGFCRGAKTLRSTQPPAGHSLPRLQASQCWRVCDRKSKTVQPQTWNHRCTGGEHKHQHDVWNQLKAGANTERISQWRIQWIQYNGLFRAASLQCHLTKSPSSELMGVYTSDSISLSNL